MTNFCDWLYANVKIKSTQEKNYVSIAMDVEGAKLTLVYKAITLINILVIIILQL